MEPILVRVLAGLFFFATLLPYVPAQCVLTSVPCPPTPPATCAENCGNTSGPIVHPQPGPVTHDAYYYKIKAYNDFRDKAFAAERNGNYEEAHYYFLQAEQKYSTKDNRYRIARTAEIVAFNKGDYELQREILIQDKANYSDKEFRSRIAQTDGFIALKRKDIVTAIADLRLALKICSKCFSSELGPYIDKLQDYLDKQQAAKNLQAQQQQAEAANKAAATQRANATVANSRADLNRSIAAAKASQQSATSAKIAASDARTQAILNGSTAQTQAAQQKISAGQLVSSTAFFGKNATDPNNPNAPYHLAPRDQHAGPGTDTNAMRSLGAVAGSSTTGAGETAGTDTRKDAGSEDARKTIDTSGSTSNYVPAPIIPTPRAEPVLTPEQTAQVNSRLAKNPDYQKLIADHAQAAKDVAKATQTVNDITTKYNAAPDGAAKQQIAVELANASQQRTNAESALMTNEARQKEIKEEEVDIIMLPPPAKKKPVEPPSPSLPPQ